MNSSNLIDAEIADNQGKLRVLAEKGNVDFSPPKLQSHGGDEESQPTFDGSTMQEYQSIASLIIKTELELIEAQATRRGKASCEPGKGCKERPRSRRAARDA